MQGNLYIVDVTNRDGVQAAGFILPKLSKTIINLYLDDFGVFQSEVGFPTLEHERSYINANLELHRLGAIKNMGLSGWCRAIPSDVRVAFENCGGLRHISLSASVSDLMITGKFGGRRQWQDVLKSMDESVRLAKTLGAETVVINAEDASRTEPQRLIDFASAGMQAGADRLRYCDTVGIENPISILKKIEPLVEAVKMPLEVHCHNDMGMAVANSLTAATAIVKAGVDCFINTTINGYGERAGNCDLITAALALRYSQGLAVVLRPSRPLNLTLSWRIARYVSNAFGIGVPVNQPVTGANIFAHESGIHADATIKDYKTYEPYEPFVVGRGERQCIETGRVILTGEYGGLSGLRYVYERLGIEIDSDSEARELLSLVQYANIHTQRPLTDEELLFIYRYPSIASQIVTTPPKKEGRD
jgi:homocitrate synthase NifV